MYIFLNCQIENTVNIHTGKCDYIIPMIFFCTSLLLTEKQTLIMNSSLPRSKLVHGPSLIKYYGY